MIKKKNQNNTSSFIDKLNSILENSQYHDIINWTQDQSAIVIKSVTKFTEIVLPAYFKHRNYSSFIRQLNMYNFNKIRHQEGDQVYMNEFFRKGNKQKIKLDRKEYKYIKRRSNNEDKQLLVPYQGANNNNSDIFLRQINQMSKRQKELEIVIKHLISDNQNLRIQNAKLWRKIQKTMEKSDKKLEKLLIYLLFGHQNMIELQDNAKKMIKEDNLESESQNLNDSRDESEPKSKNNFTNNNFISNILSMLDSNKGISNIKNMLKYMYEEKAKSNQKKKNYTIIKKKLQEEQSGQQSVQPIQNLYLKQNGEQQYHQPLQQKNAQKQESSNEHNIIEDVNLFLNVNEQHEYPSVLLEDEFFNT